MHVACVYGSIAGVHNSTFDWSLHNSGRYPRHGHVQKVKRMNSKGALSTGLSNKIQGYLTKCYWKARKQGNFINSEGVHEYDSHILF